MSNKKPKAKRGKPEIRECPICGKKVNVGVVYSCYKLKGKTNVIYALYCYTCEKEFRYLQDGTIEIFEPILHSDSENIPKKIKKSEIESINLDNLKDFYESQNNLDGLIMNNVNRVITKNELLTKKSLALMVEAAEFANRHESFKYWKKNKNNNREKLKEEYVDIFFFWLGIGNLLGISAEEVKETYIKKLEENYSRQEKGY